MSHPSIPRAWQLSTPFEQGLYRVFRLALVGNVVTVVGFVGYLSIGTALNVTGVYTPPFSVMSFSDPVFTGLGFLVGWLICLLSGSLTFLTLLASEKEANAEFVLLMGLIAFGFGAATVRVTVGPVLRLIVGLGPV
jgi:hypothetical protein